MPQPKNESAHYLDIYKLTIEKKRLQQELVSLDKRRDRIQARLHMLEQQVLDLEQRAKSLRESTPADQVQMGDSCAPNSVVYPPLGLTSSHPDNFETVTLDY